jgi:hypothetical protein
MSLFDAVGQGIASQAELGPLPCHDLIGLIIIGVVAIGGFLLISWFIVQVALR